MMSGLARRPLSPTTAGRHARLPGSADSARASADSPRASAGPKELLGSPGVRGICLTALIALVAQFALGMVLNLYVRAAGSVALTVHAVLGIALICAAIALLIRVIAGGNRLLTGLAATGLIAILGAFAAGEIFVRNRQMSASLCMAILTGVALVSYISALNLMRVVPRQQAPRPSVPAPLPGQRSAPSGPPPWIRPGFATTSPRPYSAPVTAHTGLPPWESQAAVPAPKLPVRKPFTGDFPNVPK
jgi:hypothetical protein